jgi:phospholipid/cholesterol/gamma-HCH transport system permease protein
MSSASNLTLSRKPLGPVAWLGSSVIAGLGYVGGVTLLLLRVAGSLIWPWRSRREQGEPGFIRTLMHQLCWMLYMGIPMVGLVHIAIGSFLSLQAYYGSTFVDGTGAVVGVGLLRNLGGIMSGMIFAGILSARMIPELRMMSRQLPLREALATEPSSGSRRHSRDNSLADAASDSVIPARLNNSVAPRVAAAVIASILLSLWGITVGTVVGWKASESLMGLSTEMFFMMMLKMMWFRDVLGLIVKGILFGALPAAICCYEGLWHSTNVGDGSDEAALAGREPPYGLAPPLSVPIFRAACLSMVAILVMNSSWFMLVYHAVPFYGPTLLPQP